MHQHERRQKPPEVYEATVAAQVQQQALELGLVPVLVAGEIPVETFRCGGCQIASESWAFLVRLWTPSTPFSELPGKSAQGAAPRFVPIPALVPPRFAQPPDR